MRQTLRWGILGTGNIARQFADGVRDSRRNRIDAVGSRHASTAQTFAEQHQVPRAYPTYDALLADREIDAVYVSLPNSLHCQWTIRALRAGKHVLCEKPFAMNAGEAEEMFDVAKRHDRVLVEAFMYRSHPLTAAVQTAVASGAIGKLLMIRTSFCYRTTRIANNVRFDPKLGGGGLMDIGCYCVHFARTFAGQEPNRIDVIGRLHPTGVDDIVVGTLQFPNGILASFTCGTQVQADNTAYLCGSEGFIEIPIPWKPPRLRATYVIAHAAPPRMDHPEGTPTAPPRETFYVDAPTALYGLEADDFAATVFDGAPPRVTRDDTIKNMKVLDEMKKKLHRTED